MQPSVELAGMMGFVLFLLMVAGWAAWLAGHIWLIVQAFQKSAGWGISILLLPPLGDLFYSLAHWDRARKPFFLSVAGGVLVALTLAAPFVLVRYVGVPPVAEAPGEVDSAEGETLLLGENPLPVTDRKRVADMLMNAGVDPANSRTFRGKTIEQMTEALGAPSATLKMGSEINYIFYNCFEVVSRDGGKTVSDAHYMGSRDQRA